MKKNITIFAGVMACIMLVIGTYVFVSEHYAIELNSIENAYEAEINSKTEEVEKLRAELNELESEVYSMMNGDDYSFTVNHNGVNHKYEKENDGIFSNVRHAVTKIVYRGGES